MKENALVMSVKDKKAVVLASGGRFLQIKNRNFLVGQRITLEPSLFSVSDRISFAFENTKEKISNIAERLQYKGMIIIASAAILVPSSAYAATKYVPWTYVSLDKGAVSIQYQLNARGEVLSAEALTEEGQSVIESLNAIPYEKFEDTVERTLPVIYETDQKGQSETDPFLIGITTRFGNGEGTINSITNKMDHTDPMDITVERLNWSEKEKAGAEELSIGQYSYQKNMPNNELESIDKPLQNNEKQMIPDDKQNQSEPTDLQIQPQRPNSLSDPDQIFPQKPLREDNIPENLMPIDPSDAQQSIISDESKTQHPDDPSETNGEQFLKPQDKEDLNNLPEAIVEQIPERIDDKIPESPSIQELTQADPVQQGINEVQPMSEKTAPILPEQSNTDFTGVFPENPDLNNSYTQNTNFLMQNPDITDFRHGLPNENDYYQPQLNSYQDFSPDNSSYSPPVNDGGPGPER